MIDFILYDVPDNQVRAIRGVRENQITIDRYNLPAGTYVYYLFTLKQAHLSRYILYCLAV